MSDRRIRTTETARVEAFSDGVFAIALTLLVLGLAVPAGDSGQSFRQQLAGQWPAYIAYLAAFLNIAAIWINHHDLFTRVARIDIQVICANLLLLLVSSLFPWPAAVLGSAWSHGGSHTDRVTACVLYAIIGLCVPLAWQLLYRYLSRHPQLLETPDQVGYTRDGVRRSMFSTVVYPIAAAVAFAAPVVSLILFAVVPMFFIATLLGPSGSQAPGTGEPT